MKIAVITNSRIPSLTANSIQAMKVAQALMQLGHDLRMFAPRETEPASKEALAAHSASAHMAAFNKAMGSVQREGADLRLYSADEVRKLM